MTDPLDHYQEILEIFPPNRLYEFVEDAKDIVHLYEDMVRYQSARMFNEVPTPIAKVRIKRALSLIIQFSERNASDLMRIKEKFGDITR